MRSYTARIFQIHGKMGQVTYVKAFRIDYTFCLNNAEKLVTSRNYYAGPRHPPPSPLPQPSWKYMIIGAGNNKHNDSIYFGQRVWFLVLRSTVTDDFGIHRFLLGFIVGYKASYSSETLAILWYANSARNIKNAPTKNVDPTLLEIKWLNTLSEVMQFERVKQFFCITQNALEDNLRNDDTEAM